MPHTDSDAIIPDPVETPMTVEAAQRVEQEKLSRRAALRKLGFGAGLAAFSLLGVDDFARMVGQRLQRNAHDNKTALAVAKEFQSAGIALADNPSSSFKCSIIGCKDSSECNPDKLPWLHCTDCMISGCVQQAESFNCKKGDLNECMDCCIASQTACNGYHPAPPKSSYNCQTLFTGCQTMCGS